MATSDRPLAEDEKAVSMIEQLDGLLEGNGQLGLPELRELVQEWLGGRDRERLAIGETHAANLGSKAYV